MYSLSQDLDLKTEDARTAGKLDALQRPPVIIGIDPDSNGALAVIEVQSYPQPGAQVIEDVVVRLHDNPCEVLQATKQRKRRCVCCCAWTK